MYPMLFRVFTPEDLIDIAIRNGLHFDQTRQTGIVFHMLATIAENGRIGATVIGDTQAEADELYRKMEDALKAEADEALRPLTFSS